jgi:CDP-glycerol glycerophosphotransferase (TagB/SpsB family)
VPDNIVKKQGQVYIQTKHWASVTLKKFYLDSKTITDIPEDVAYWKRDSQKIDYITTGSDFDTESSRRGFDFHKDVVQIGSPRSDAMFMKEKYKKKVCCAFGLDMSTRILLYAPTYRYQKGKAVHLGEVRDVDLDYDAVRNMLESRFGGEWCIMLRLHPGNEKEIEKLKLPDYVIDASMYSDGQEIVSACDVLISDYSSIMFEPAFVKKPVFLFATDRKDYIDKEYDLLIDYDTLPFPIAESNEELVRNIVNFDRAKYEKKLDDFMDRYGVHEDGHASERAAEFISWLIDGQ